MVTIERLHKLSNQIDSEEKQIYPNETKLKKGGEQLDRIFTKVGASTNLQEQYEEFYACEWEEI